MSRMRGGSSRRQRVRAGAPDASLTANAGLAVVTELCGRLGVIEVLDAAVGPIKQRDRGFGAGELLCGIAAAQLAGEDFLTGLDRQRADAAGQLITPVLGLASTTAAGLVRFLVQEDSPTIENFQRVIEITDLSSTNCCRELPSEPKSKPADEALSGSALEAAATVVCGMTRPITYGPNCTAAANCIPAPPRIGGSAIPLLRVPV